MYYSWQDVRKAFFLTPIPLLMMTSLLFTVQNHEYRISSIVALLVAHLLIYIIFCIVCAPVGLLLSWFLNKYRLINVLTILMSVILMITPFFMFLGWMYTGKEIKSWWEYWDGAMLLFTVFITASYFLILKWLHGKRKVIRLSKKEDITL